MFRQFTLIILLTTALFLVACSSSGEEIALAVNQTVAAQPSEMIQETVEVPVTVEVTVEKEVTRVVEIEVEVTSVVEVEKEVTRVVEVEITPIPTETPEPSPTPTAAPTTAAADNPPASAPASQAADTLEEQFITEIEIVKREMDAYVRMIDGALASGIIDCEEVVERHDRVKLSRQFDVANERGEVQGAYPSYRTAVDVFVNGTRDMSENCRSFLADPTSGGGIPRQQWGLARVEASKSVDIIVPAIRLVGGDVG